MITSETLQLLRCPETLQRLQPATEAQLKDIQQRVAAGTLKNRGGKAVTDSLDEALVREDGKILYPVRQNIPVLLIEEGIAI